MQSHGWNLLQLDMWSLIQHHSSGPHLNEDSLYLLATLPYISWLRMRPRLALGSVLFVVYAQKWNRKYSQERKSSTSGLGVLIVFSCSVYQLRMWCGGLQLWSEENIALDDRYNMCCIIHIAHFARNKLVNAAWYDILPLVLNQIFRTILKSALQHAKADPFEVGTHQIARAKIEGKNIASKLNKNKPMGHLTRSSFL